VNPRHVDRKEGVNATSVQVRHLLPSDGSRETLVISLRLGKSQSSEEHLARQRLLSAVKAYKDLLCKQMEFGSADR